MKKMITAVVVTAVLLLLFPQQRVFGAQTMPPGLLIGDETGIHVQSDGSYFIVANDMEAGDVIQKTLTIQNTERSTFDLSLTARPLAQTGPIDLLYDIDCRLLLDGREIYRGRVYGDDGVNMVANALDLGTYGPDDTKVMQIELQLNETIPDELFYEKSIAEVQWIFYAVKKADAAPPHTGLADKPGAFALGTVFLVGSALLLYKKSRRGAL